MYIFDLFLLFISYLILVLFILIAVGFLTLCERKILGFIQNRKGPNKVGFMDLIEPFSDALKLFCKEQINPNMSNLLSYYFSPIFNLFLALLLWFFYHFFFIYIFLVLFKSFCLYYYNCWLVF